MSLLSTTERKAAAERIRHIFRTSIPTRITRMSVVDWAAEKRVLPKGFSPYPGPFRWEVMPYLREIADCLSETNPTRKVAVMKGAQLGFTVGIGENWVGYIIDAAPGPTLYISGDAEMAKTSAGRRIDAMIQHAGLGDKIFAQSIGKRSRKTGDTAMEKQFAGGWIRAIGPKSGSKLRSDSVQYLYGDEVDAYPQSAGKEGDPIALAERRTDAFEQSRKLLYTSTPLVEQTSRIRELYNDGDKRKFYVPCKHCGHMQPLKWDRLKWDTDDDDRLIWASVRYECEKCGGEWKNEDKAFFLPRGEWKPTQEASEPGYRSYHLSSLYSPVGFRSWESGVQEFLKAKGDPVKLQTFVNTFLGETWVDEGERPRVEALISRTRRYKIGTLPEDAQPLFVTIGADVQADRIECEIVAWGRDKESWSINYQVFPGETDDLDSDAWSGLRDTINSTYADMSPVLSAVDAGYRTDVVYQFADSFEAGVHPVMGYDTLGKGRDYIKPYTVEGRSTPRIDVNTDLMKQEVYRYLNKGQYESGRYPPGFMHMPAEYSREHMNRLTAESRIPAGNQQGYKWDAGGRRNEQLDCRVYALAMVYAYKRAIEEHEEAPLTWAEFWDYVDPNAGREGS
jgi:phage terminase large subunit GpA-like protein